MGGQRSRQGEDGDPDRRLGVEPVGHVAALGPQLDPGHVAELNHLAAVADLHHHLLELLDGRQPAQGREGKLERLPRVSGPSGSPEQAHISSRLNRLLTQAEDEAATLKDDYVSIEHLLLAMTFLQRKPLDSRHAAQRRELHQGNRPGAIVDVFGVPMPGDANF